MRLHLPQLKPMQWLLLIASAFYLVVLAAFDPKLHWWIPKCPFLWATGWRCAGCGSQRAIHALLQGDVATAWQTHPLLWVALPYILLGFYTDTQTHTRVGMWLRTRLYGRTAILACMVIVLGYTVLRNVQGW